MLITSVNADVVKKLIINNNDRISEETIKTYGQIEIGKDYNNEDINNILKNLYDTDFFKNISLKLDGDTLIIDVEENKIIQSVNIEGVDSSRIKESILKNLYSKDKAPFLIEKVKSDKIRILNSLNNSGYYLANVDVETKENSNDTINLIFKIDLGDKAVISKIEFVGDKKIKDRILRNIIISEEAKFWKVVTTNKFLNKSKIERDKRLLINFYLNNGYYDIDIESVAAKFSEDSTFKLTYKINAGEIYNIENAKLNLPIDYDEQNFKDVKLKLDKLLNKTYSLSKVSEVVEEIDKVSLTREYDFINADLEEIKKDNNKLDLIFNIKESEKFYIEQINIFGNNVTYESVIRNQLEIDEGDPYNELLSAKSINNIRATNLFKSVSTDVKDGSEISTKIIDINVEEKPTGEISVGAGVGSEGGTVGFSVSENNFLGKGIRLSSSINLSEDSISGDFTVDNPNFNYSGKSLFTSISSLATDKLTDNGYKSNKTAFIFGTGFEQFENVFFSPKLSNSYEDLTTSSKASASLKKQEGTYYESKFSYGINYDMRNQKFQTSEGFRTQFNQSIPLISNDWALGNSLDYKIWQKLPNNMVTSFNAYGKAVHSIFDEDVRITNRFYLPRQKLKGFVTRKVGPKDGKDYVGGNYATAINLDTTLPMIFSQFETLDMRYFIDAANIWGVDYSKSVDQSNTLRASTGVVIDWFTPIGPLNVSFAQDLSKADDDKTEFFQFNLGTTF